MKLDGVALYNTLLAVKDLKSEALKFKKPKQIDVTGLWDVSFYIIQDQC